jgi:hypothetical protein
MTENNTKTNTNLSRLKKILTAEFDGYNFGFRIDEDATEQHEDHDVFEVYFDHDGYPAGGLKTLTIQVFHNDAPMAVWIEYDYESRRWVHFRIGDESIKYLWQALLWRSV